ncbi:MAG: ABC transporter permease [Actinomycetota bacterium]
MIAFVLFGAAYLTVAVLAIRRPLLARLAAREALRRRGQSLLVIGGLMIGAAGITAALIGADSSRDSAVLNAYRAWGMTDVTATAREGLFPEEYVQHIAIDPNVAGLTDGVQGGLELVGSVADLTKRQGESGVRLIGFDPAEQQAFGRYLFADGGSTFGDDLGDGGVLLSRQLGNQLDAERGDRLRLTAEVRGRPRTASFTVAGIARSIGPGAYGLVPAVFAPLDELQGLSGLGSGINVIRISANGGLKTDADADRRVISAIQRDLREVRPRAEGPFGTHLDFEVRPVKTNEVRQAEENTQFVRALLIGMSALIIAAGAALVVNLVLMLAEERRPRLAVLRALGLTRRGLILLSVFEGALYSLVAAAVGTLVGLGAGRIVALRFAKAFAQFAGGEADFRFVFSVHPGTLAVGFAAGALLTLLTVFLAARRTSRMSIPAAIRDLPEPARERRRRWPRIVVLSVSGVLGVLLVAQSDNLVRLLGGMALILTTAGVTRRRWTWLSPRAHASLFSFLLAVWAFFMVGRVNSENDPNKFFSVFTVAQLGAVFGLSVLAANNLRAVERFMGFLGGASKRLRTTLRPPLAYMSRRAIRTGLATGVFAVILAIVALFAVFLSIFKPQVERDSGGYDVRVISTGATTVTLPPSVTKDVVRTAPIPTIGYIGRLHTDAGFGNSESQFVPLLEFSPSLMDEPPVFLTARDDRFDDVDAVWRAVQRAGSRWVVSDFGNPGQYVTLQGSNGPVRFRIAANQSFGVLDGVIGTAAQFDPFAQESRGETLLVDTSDDAEPREVARRIERSLFSLGVDATTTERLLDKGYRAQRTFFSVIDVLMRMGLVVGILSLGILSLRAVVERRHAIGVLRAIGYRRRQVMAGLLAEAGLTATIGVVVGFTVGTVMGYIFFQQSTTGNAFGMDGASAGSALGLVYGAVLLVSLGPAWRASRLPPAEAVRYSE